ncbi:MAG: polysaccharide deacetylase family protein [Verrucomicrobia bacterium]|nr:polysaccharide deacetylase family protein [Verrucomicrobiota bacterium]
MSEKALVVSLHDVSPHTWPACAAMLADLAKIGVARTSLLVVPNHHGRGHFLADPMFCRELEKLAANGHEIVVHGYEHRRARRADESARTRWITQIYTADEGEFFDLEEAAAAAVLKRAKEDFAQLDLPAPPVGFIAPAWLLGEAAGRAVRAAGFRYTTRLGSVETYLPNDGLKVTHSQSLVWSPRNAWRRQVSLWWNASLARRLRANALLRVGLHPPDFRFPAIWRQARALIGDALREGRAVRTYAEFIDTSSA